MAIPSATCNATISADRTIGVRTSAGGSARTQDPDSANSQFFICLDDANFLDGQYTYWGAVVDGMDAVDAIKKGAGFRDGVVDDPDKIVKMTVAADEA